MKKLDSIILIIITFGFLLTIGMIMPARAKNNSQEPGELLKNLKMAKLFNPELTNTDEYQLWLQESQNLIEWLANNDTLLSVDDIQLIRYFLNLLPVFTSCPVQNLEQNLLTIFDPEVQSKQELLKVMNKSYVEISQLFQNQIQLPKSTGYFFVLVLGKKNVDLGKIETSGLTFKGSRFIIMSEAAFTYSGLRLPDINSFYKTFRHELIHAFINVHTGYEKAIQLPDWFQEMVAVYYGGSKRFEARGQQTNYMPEEYQDYFDAARHLFKQGEQKFHFFIRQSLSTGQPEPILHDLYGYSSFDALRESSFSFIEKISLKTKKIYSKFKIRFKPQNIPILLLYFIFISLPFYLIFLSVRSSITDLKTWRAEFDIAEKMMQKNDFRQALLTYHSFFKNIQAANFFEAVLIHKKQKVEFANEQIHLLQTKLLQQYKNQIKQAPLKNLMRAEELIKSFTEDARLLFKDNYLKDFLAFMETNVPDLISEIWQKRKLVYLDLCNDLKFDQATRNCLYYAIEFKNWSYFPLKLVVDQLEIILSKWFDYAKNQCISTYSSSIVQDLQRIISNYKNRSIPQIVEHLLFKFIDEIETFFSSEAEESILNHEEAENPFLMLNNYLILLKQYSNQPLIRNRTVNAIKYLLTKIEQENINLCSNQSDKIIFLKILGQYYSCLLNILNPDGDFDELSDIETKLLKIEQEIN